jgi:hypothetical protein
MLWSHNYIRRSKTKQISALEELEYKRHLISTLSGLLEASTNEISVARDQFLKTYGSKYTIRIQEMRKDIIVLTGLGLTFLGILSAYVEGINANQYQHLLFLTMILIIIVGFGITIALTIWKSKSSEYINAIETGHLSILFRINVMKGFVSSGLFDFQMSSNYQIYLMRQCVLIGLASRNELYESLKKAAKSRWINCQEDKDSFADLSKLLGLAMMNAYFRFRSHRSQLEDEFLVGLLLDPPFGWAEFLNPKKAFEGIYRHEGVIKLK